MTIRRKVAALALIACAALAPVAFQAAAAPDPAGAEIPYTGLDPKFAEVLKRFDAAQVQVTSLSARFVERKEIGLLKNAVVLKGRFYHTKPDKFLWEYVSPEPKILLMNGKSLVAYYPLHKEAEEIQTRLSRRLVKYFGLGQVFAEMQEYYTLSLDPNNDVAGTHLIVMKPRQRRLEKRLQEVRLWLDAQLNQVRQLEYRETDGDRTLFTFDEILVNPSISPARYEIKLPEDVKVSGSFSGFFSEKGR